MSALNVLLWQSLHENNLSRMHNKVGHYRCLPYVISHQLQPSYKFISYYYSTEQIS
jgi:hypothetical protein